MTVHSVRQFVNLSIEIIAKAHYSWLLEEDSTDLLLALILLKPVTYGYSFNNK